MTTFLVCEICQSRHPAEAVENMRCKKCAELSSPRPALEPIATVMPCTYCQKLFKPKRAWQKFCCPAHAEMFRRFGHGTVIGLLKQENQNLRERLALERELWRIERDGLIHELGECRRDLAESKNSR